MKLFVWKSHSFHAVAHAESVDKARIWMLNEMGESGDGSCPERDEARRTVLSTTPEIWVGPNAEFALTDSAELREMDDYVHKKDAELAALRKREKGYLSELADYGETVKRLRAENEKLRAALAEVKTECMESIDCNHQDADDGSDDCTNIDDCVGCTIVAICEKALKEARDARPD